MNYMFLFLETKVKEISNNKFIVVSVLEFNSHRVFDVYKKYNDKLFDSLKSLDRFQNINDLVAFAIKRDGKISLDINY